MTISAVDHTQDFVRFWQSEFPNKQCPAVPKKPDDLGITEVLALESWNNGKLFQNLFGNSGKGTQTLPADVQLRLNSNALLPQDAPALRAANLEHLAQQCEEVGQRQQDQRLADEAIKGRKEYLEAKKQSEMWANASLSERYVMAPPSPEAVARARAEWGITGKANWEK